MRARTKQRVELARGRMDLDERLGAGAAVFHLEFVVIHRTIDEGLPGSCLADGVDLAGRIGAPFVAVEHLLPASHRDLNAPKAFPARERGLREAMRAGFGLEGVHRLFCFDGCHVSFSRFACWLFGKPIVDEAQC